MGRLVKRRKSSRVNNNAAALLGVKKLIKRFGRRTINICLSKLVVGRIARGRLRKKARNGSLGGVPPYGYCVVGSRRDSQLKPLRKEQKVLSQILYWRNKKLSSWEIMKKINAKGLRNRNRKKFECYQIKRIIDRAQGVQQ